MPSDMTDADVLTKVVTKDLEIGILPQFIGREKSCVNKLLKQRKFKYNPDLNGILIRYEDLEFISDTGRIIDDTPLIFWKIRAKFHIFSVQHGAILTSFVNRIGKKYIQSSFANCIDVTIKFVESLYYEIEEEICSCLKVGDPIKFRVKSFTPSQRYIEGIIDQEVYEELKNPKMAS